MSLYLPNLITFFNETRLLAESSMFLTFGVFELPYKLDRKDMQMAGKAALRAVDNECSTQ